MPSSPDPHTAWAAILDEFDAQLARVDLLTAELSDAGVVLPLSDLAELVADPGPLPEHLVARARTVLTAQQEAMARLEGLRRELSRHIGVARAADSRPDVAVYLDRSA